MKKVVFQLDLDLFIKAKVHAVQNGQNMTQYLISLIEKDLQGNKTEDGNEARSN